MDKEKTFPEDTVVEAVFTGSKEIMGYIPHVTYTMKIFPTRKFPINAKQVDAPKGHEKQAILSYRSVKHFLSDWSNIIVKKK